MHNSPLLQTLRLIPSSKLKRYEAYVKQSTTQKDYMKLCTHIVEFGPSFKGEALKREKLIDEIFPENPQKLKAVAAQLKKMAEQFLVISEVRMTKNGLSRAGKMLLLESLTPNFQLFSTQCNKRLNEIDKQSVKDAQDYFDAHRCYTQLFYHHETEKYQQEVPTLDLAGQNLDQGYLISRLRLLIEEIHRRKIHTSVAIKPAEEFITKLAGCYREVPTIHFYLQLIELFHKPEVNLYQEVHSYYLNHFAEISPLDQQIGINKLIHIANAIYERGALEFLETIFSLYQFAENKGLLSNYGRIAPITFVNVVIIGYHLGKWEWTTDFHDRYFPLLSPEQQPEIKQLCLAYFHYYHKQYDDALDRLLAIPKGEHSTNNLRRRVLEIWIYYELDSKELPMEELLEAALERLRKFLSNQKKWNEAKKKTFQNYQALTLKLLYRKQEQGILRDHQKTLALKERILNEEPLFSRPWLLVKVEELLQS